MLILFPNFVHANSHANYSNGSWGFCVNENNESGFLLTNVQMNAEGVLTLSGTNLQNIRNIQILSADKAQILHNFKINSKNPTNIIAKPTANGFLSNENYVLRVQ